MLVEREQRPQRWSHNGHALTSKLLHPIYGTLIATSLIDARVKEDGLSAKGGFSFDPIQDVVEIK